VDPARLARTQLVADDAPLICTLGRDGRDADRPLSADALERLVPHAGEAACQRTWPTRTCCAATA
jgi:hypothetical protein